MPLLDGIRRLDELTLESKKALLRLDFDVPLEKDGRLRDSERVRAALPTVQAAIAAGARVIIASHLGRGSGKRKPELSLEAVGAELSELGGFEVYLPDDCVGDAARKVVSNLRSGQVCLLENLRYRSEETHNDEAFARKLLAFSDVYVNDAPRQCHLAHASLSALPKMVHERGAGLLLHAELTALDRLLLAEPPFVAVLGGPHVQERLSLIERLIGQLTTLCLGGSLAASFLAARGTPTGATPVDEHLLARIRSLAERARDLGVEVLVPDDVVVIDHPRADVGRPLPVQSVSASDIIADIGPETRARYATAITRAKTVFSLDALGLTERPAFRDGTRAMLEAMTQSRGFTLLGEGDSVSALRATEPELLSRIGHVSHGGDASLELIKGQKLPGLSALKGS